MFSKPQVKFYHATKHYIPEYSTFYVYITLISQRDKKYLNWDTENGKDSKGLTIKYEAGGRAKEDIYLLSYHVTNVQPF